MFLVVKNTPANIAISPFRNTRIQNSIVFFYYYFKPLLNIILGTNNLLIHHFNYYSFCVCVFVLLLNSLYWNGNLK